MNHAPGRMDTVGTGVGGINSARSISCALSWMPRDRRADVQGFAGAGSFRLGDEKRDDNSLLNGDHREVKALT